jgi:hypothetical protein
VLPIFPGRGNVRQGTAVGRKVAILIQRGALNSQQEQACLDYLAVEHWSMESLVPYWAVDDAVALVRSGVVDRIVAAFDSPMLRQLAADIGAAGRVVFVHPAPTTIEPVQRSLPDSIVDLIRRWRRRGKSIKEIAADVEGDTGDIRAILRDLGEEPTGPG